jgi:hypothetical protein
MEFDADWIWFAIFAGVMVVRALGSLISRSRKRELGGNPTVQIPQARRDQPSVPSVSTMSSATEFNRDQDAKPIEPR